MTSHMPTKILIFVLISLFLSSCDKKPTEKTSIEKAQTTEVTSIDEVTKTPDLEKLKVRALARWNALIDSEWSEAYSYNTPSYRKNYSRKDFINGFGSAVGWRKIEFKSLNNINDKLVDVTLILNISFDAGSTSMVVPTNIIERWQFTDNNWCYVKK